jgi:hypothetical protein
MTIADATGNGISWTLRRAASQPAGAVTFGQFVNGDYWVIGPVELISVTPGHALSNGVDVHGSVINFDPNGAFQGLDGRCVFPGTNCIVGYMKPYQQSLNVTRNLASGPLTISTGSSLMTVRSRVNLSVPSSAYATGIMDASVLTVLSAPPPADAFRPPYAGADKTIYFRESNIEWTRLLAVPTVSGAPSITTIANQFRRVWLDHDEWNARMIHPFNNMPEYGRDFTALLGEGLVLANMNFTQSQKRDLVIRLAQIGIDFYANVIGGATWNGTGGQGSGRKAPILFAGALFNNAGMLNIGVNYPSYRAVVNGNVVNYSRFGEDSQTFFVEQTSPGIVNWQSPSSPLTPYNMSHVGNPRLPEWGFNHVDYPSNDQPGWNADSYRRCCTANSWVGQTLAIKAMGLEDEWAHDAYFKYMDRYMVGQLAWIQTDPVNQQHWHRSWVTWLETAWDTYRPGLGGYWTCNFPTNICLGQ